MSHPKNALVLATSLCLLAACGGGGEEVAEEVPEEVVEVVPDDTALIAIDDDGWAIDMAATTVLELDWDLEPDDPGDLNPPEVDGDSVLRIGTNLAVENRKNGHPDSSGTATTECGGSGGTCTISFSWGTRTGADDGETLTVKVSVGGASDSITVGRGDSPLQSVSVAGCGTAQIEVTAGAGNDPADIESAFEIVFTGASCS